MVKGAGPCGPDEGFQFREGHFDRIEIRTVGRQEAQLGADGFDGDPCRGVFMDDEVVEDDHVTRTQRGHQDLFDVGEKRRVIERSIEHGRRPQTVETQRRDHRVRLPMIAGRVIAKPGAAQTATVAPEQIRPDAALVEKHILAHVAKRLPDVPLAPGRRHIRPALLVGVHRFF